MIITKMFSTQIHCYIGTTEWVPYPFFVKLQFLCASLVCERVRVRMVAVCLAVGANTQALQPTTQNTN